VKRAPEPQQPIELAAFSERIEPAHGRHHGLAWLAVDPMAFHQLKIFEATGSLGAEVHASLRFACTGTSEQPRESSYNCDSIGTT
jgi:hypothetical protein